MLTGFNRIVRVLLLLSLSGCAVQPSNNPPVQSSTTERDPRIELGLAYLNQGRLQLARQHLQKALGSATELSPSWLEIHYALALLEMRSEHEERSETHFLQALRGQQGYPDAENGYGVLLCRMGRKALAQRYFLRAINNPDYATPEVAANNQKACGDEW